MGFDPVSKTELITLNPHAGKNDHISRVCLSRFSDRPSFYRRKLNYIGHFILLSRTDKVAISPIARTEAFPIYAEFKPIYG